MGSTMYLHESVWSIARDHVYVGDPRVPCERSTTARKPVSFLKRWLFHFLWCACVILGGCGIPTTSMQSPASTPTSWPEPSPGAFVTCQTRQLLLVAGQTTSELGNAGVQLSFENRSPVSCTLIGYPTLHLLDAQQKPLQAQITRSTYDYLYSTRPPQMISLHPGQQAYFAVTWANLGCGKIPPASYASPVSFLQVTPPLNQASLLVEVHLCAFRNQVTVSPVESSQVLGVFSARPYYSA